MDNVLIRKLERFAPLSADDKRLLGDIVEPRHTVDAGRVLVAEGQASETVRLIVDGLACRYKNLADGRRQIVAYLVPGDFCDLNGSILKAVDHTIATLSPCTVVDIPRDRIVEVTSRPGLTRAFWWVTLVDEGTLREWLLNIGQRRAVERLAHLFCELFARMQAVGLTRGNSYDLPIVQNDLADTLGLSLVHVNRCVQQLRDLGLVEFRRGTMTIVENGKLQDFCGFDPGYLHLNHGYGSD